MTMLERIAKAIGKTIPGRSELTYVTPATLLAAEAVLDAMLEPTDAMIDAGHDAVGPFCDHNPGAAWGSMIQAAKDGA